MRPLRPIQAKLSPFQREDLLAEAHACLFDARRVLFVCPRTAADLTQRALSLLLTLSGHAAEKLSDQVYGAIDDTTLPSPIRRGLEALTYFDDFDQIDDDAEPDNDTLSNKTNWCYEVAELLYAHIDHPFHTPVTSSAPGMTPLATGFMRAGRAKADVKTQEN
jgi:hypothetical protein